MKARIRQDAAGYYIGEIYGTWDNWLLGTSRTGWKKVTDVCNTKWGAKRELEKWKDKHCPEEFEM